ncbi:hypothetical protein ACFY2M_39935 [Streptomyces sp. NPDC001276]
MLGKHLGIQIEDLRLPGITVLLVGAMAMLRAAAAFAMVGVCWCA